MADELDNHRQPQFKSEDPNEISVWVYSLFTDVPGDFVKKPMKDCTGEEITQEGYIRLAFLLTVLVN